MRVGSITLATKEISKYKKKGKSVGLITGNFDLIHIGHTRLFNFAKKNVDILAIGIDSNEISNTYRHHFEAVLNPLSNRLELLENLKNVDLVFPITSKTVNSKGFDIEMFHYKLLSKLKPTHIITNPIGDIFYAERKERCELLNIKILEFWNSNVLELQILVKV